MILWKTFPKKLHRGHFAIPFGIILEVCDEAFTTL